MVAANFELIVTTEFVILIIDFPHEVLVKER